MAVPISTEQLFKRHQKVVADADLAGVPRGTRGRVMYVAGMTWFRYRVQFENGVERGNLDGRHLVSVDEWDEREREEALAARRAEQERRAEELKAQVLAAQAD